MRDLLDRISLFSGFNRVIAASGVFAALLPSSVVAQQFQNPPHIVTPLDPIGLVAGDWNEDGNPDLAYVTTTGVPVLQLLLGNGKGGFSQGATVSLPAGTCTYEETTCRMTVGNFTSHTHQDILMPGNFSTGLGFLVLPGNGDGTFGAPVISTFVASADLGTFVPYQAAVADFNGDRHLDIAVPDYLDGRINIYLGDAKGGFDQGKNLQDNAGPYAAYAADVNHDGKIDLIVFDVYEAGASIWLGDGEGGFTEMSSKGGTGGNFRARAVADLRGDGTMDLIGGGDPGDVEVMTGNADGTFNAPQTVATGVVEASPVETEFYAADLTGDGIPELLVTTQEGFDTIVAKSPLVYGSAQMRSSGPFATQIAIADFNRDGIPDFAAGVSGGIELFFGNKQGKFSDGTVHRTSPPVTSLFAGNFAGNSVSDVTALGADGYLRTYVGVKGGGFQPPVKSPTAVAASFYYLGNTVGDFDGDGRQDILVDGQVFYGNGDGSFAPVTLNTANNGLVADLNKDGKSDLLSISPLQYSMGGSYPYFYGLIALLGKANRTFAQVSTNFPPYGAGIGSIPPVLLAVGDLNADGYPDAAVYDPNLSTLETWIGEGDGNFHAGTTLNLSGTDWTPQGTLTLDSQIGVGAIADMDGDGKADLVFLATQTTQNTNQPAAYVLVIEYGNGKGGFGSKQVLPLTHAFNAMTLAKLDTSGHPGIVLASGSQISVIRNLGERQYSNEEFYSAGAMTGVLAADFTGSGLSDILPLRADAEGYNTGAFGFTVLLNQPAVKGEGSGVAEGTLTASPATVNYNQGFTLTAELQPSQTASPIPTGTLVFSALGHEFGSVTLQEGNASIQVSGAATQLLPPGEVTIAANYSGDSFYASTSLTALLQVLNPVYGTHTELTASVDGVSATNVQIGSFLSLNANVSAPQAVKSGYVAFFDGANILGQAAIAGGQAGFSTNLLSIGSHKLTGQYLGFIPPNPEYGLNSFLPSISAAATVQVTAVPTTAKLTPSALSVSAGAELKLTARVTSAVGSPIGGITFLDGTEALGTMTLDASGSATLSTILVVPGQHSLMAQYGANDIYAGSLTPVVKINVIPSPVAGHSK